MIKMDTVNSLSPDFKNVGTLWEGMDNAIVTFSVNKEGKLCKVVTFFSNEDTQFDAITVGNSKIIKDCRNFLGYRHFLYKVKEMVVKRLDFNWNTIFISTKDDE